MLGEIEDAKRAEDAPEATATPAAQREEYDKMRPACGGGLNNSVTVSAESSPQVLRTFRG